MRIRLTILASALLATLPVTELAAQERLEALPLARLVPEATTVFFEFTSVEAAWRDVQALATGFDEAPFESEDDFLTDLLSLSLHLDSVALVDRKRPFGVALQPRMDGATEVFLIPAKDPEALAKALAEQNEGKHVFVSDTYVVWTDEPDYRPSSADHPLAVGSTRGAMRLRLDLATLLKQFESEIRPTLETAREASGQGSSDMAASWILDPSNAIDASFDAVDAFFKSARRLELNLEVEGGMARLLAQLDTIEGSPMSKMGLPGSTVISRLASALDLDQPLVVLFGADMASWRKHVGGFVNAFVEGLPEGARADFDKILSATDEDLRALGTGVGLSLGMGKTGLVAELVTSPTNAARCTTRVTEALANPAWKKLGIRVDGPLPLLVASSPAIRWRMRIDPEVAKDEASGRIPAAQAAGEAFKHAFPSNEMSVSLLQSRDLAALVIAAEEEAANRTLARLGPVKTSTKEIEFALQALGRANPCALAQIDLGVLGRDFVGNIDETRSPHTPLVLWGGVDRDVWRAGMAADLAKLRALALESKKQAPIEHAEMSPLQEANTELTTVRGALDLYAAKNAHKFPDTLDVLAIKDPNGSAYLADAEMLVDPWGRPYLYENDGSEFGPRVWTYGADGRPGGSGLDTDLDTDILFGVKRR